MADTYGNAWLVNLGKAMAVLAVAICVQSSLTAQTALAKARAEKPWSQVPFVGCKSDGQLGPLDAPTGKSKVVSITAKRAQDLAYYQAEEGSGVLGPRGWYCFGTYGSNGNNLYVTPSPIEAKLFFLDIWSGFSGPAIQLSLSYGGTSGRFEVAHIIARVFPAHRAFVQSVIKEGLEPSRSFLFSPYPKDTLTYKSKEIVEYETLANGEGLGTNSRLQKNGNPISGVAILSGPLSEPDLWLLSTRLPPSLADLSTTIVQQVERDVAKSDQ